MLKSMIRLFAGGRSRWANAGPVLVLGLLIYCMVFSMAEPPSAVSELHIDEEAAHMHAAAIEDAIMPEARAAVPEADAPKPPELTEGWAISIDDEPTVYLASKAEAEAVLENVRISYLPEGGEVVVLNAEFVETVGLLPEVVSLDDLSTPDQALTTLTEGKETLQEYVVQKGDNYWDIARKNNTTVDELLAINNADSNKLQIGDVLKLNRVIPLISVKMTFVAVGEESIPYGTVYKNNDDAYRGQSKVLSAGVKGTMEVEYEVDQINGIAVERRVLSETVIAKPVDQVVEAGTKVIVASRGSGDNAKSGALAWPVRGKINSPFGNRSRGYHSGIDIQARTGDPVYSSLDGTVISASYSGGYGNLVTIDHGDGLTTLYAHLSKINVSVGQVVGDQELIGLAGTTGRTTGPHLHFEVRINGSPVNPANYLN
ncbi:MAG: M23 family metallopeptidase [Clostridiales bacterium]|nr:M23 family metallopeptidase [Clostridiales bacterium]